MLKLPEPLPEEDVPLDGELPLVLELPDMSLLDELLPDVLLPLMPELLEELSLFGVSTVVVVVTVPDAPLLGEDELAPDEELLALDGSVVVVVVVVCPNVIVAVPSSDRKIAIGNFFMFAPSLIWIRKTPEGKDLDLKLLTGSQFFSIGTLRASRLTPVIAPWIARSVAALHWRAMYHWKIS
ncbi:hypothetical protein [Noviherbaspirillum sp. ST9]|uniref:hypothetical protein n=1 Tax=Noviherbaspirillum sp. ST9 TaxID=3401606 RepID=UPI003B5884C5